MMEIRYALMPEDQGSYWQHVHRGHRVGPLVAVAVVPCLLGLTIARCGLPFAGLSVIANAALSIAGLAVAIVLIVSIVHAAFTLGRRLLPCTRPLLECTLRLASYGVSRTDGQSEAVWKWTAVEQIVEGRHHIFMCMALPAGVTASRVLTVPKRAFADEQHATAFLAEARRIRGEP